MLYSYKFSRDVYFENATNPTFLQFFEDPWPEFVNNYAYKINFKDQVFMMFTLSAKTTKFMSLKI